VLFFNAQTANLPLKEKEQKLSVGTLSFLLGSEGKKILLTSPHFRVNKGLEFPNIRDYLTGGQI
jgi:hypothetical protein